MEIWYKFIKEKMMKYTCLFLFYLFSCKAKLTVQVLAPKGFHLMIQTGLIDIETINQLNYSAKKYRVKFYNVGCVVSKPRRDSIKKINDSISIIVQSQFGDNWLLNLRSEIDTLNKVKQIAQMELVKRKISYNESLYYLVSPSLQKNNYLVRTYTWEYENTMPGMHFHHYLGVNYKKKLVFEVESR